MKTIGIVCRAAEADRARIPMVTRLIEEAGGRVVGEEDLKTSDVVLVLGGDGTILRAAEGVRGTEIPVIGVNFGHVGFLAEADPESLSDVVSRLVAGEYTVETRTTLAVTVTQPDGSTEEGWALNELALDKVERARMVDLTIGVDEHPISSYSCDALVVSTPTGSTAYAFSAGGPVVWPDVEALLIVPIAAHALFARPLVVAPDSIITVVMNETGFVDGELWCDGRRSLAAPVGSHIEIRRSAEPVHLARLWTSPFSGRLVAKFKLPVRSWKHPDKS
ncbi:NAD kinase [Bowdeniella nasicola]|uniref:NAD kinase n=1 Tax=Bowdeniella nasicola TaxID=208480 RepID=A0A1Q5Q4R2_9ACTO|nr:NAD kinase [Bowdeniella nasicola]OKL54818.1 NAD kinase [Bowdeniella nasicola]